MPSCLRDGTIRHQHSRPRHLFMEGTAVKFAVTLGTILLALCCIANAQIGPVPGTFSGGYVGKQPISLRSLGSNTQSGSGHTTTTLTTTAPIHPGDAVLVFYANSDNSLI